MFELPSFIPQQLRGQPLSFSIPYLGIAVGVVGVLGSGIALIKGVSQQEPIEAQSEICINQTFQGEVTVYVSGAVKYPGIYTLPTGQRVAHALSAAGGASEDAQTLHLATELNLAQPLEDGQKIYIPSVSVMVNDQKKAPDAQTPSSTGISINTATAAQLSQLPRIGEKTAEKIIENRPYETIEQLVEKKVVSEQVLLEIRDLVLL